MKDRYSIIAAAILTAAMVWVLRVVFVWWEIALVGVVTFLVAEHFIEKGLLWRKLPTVAIVVGLLWVFWGVEASGMLHAQPQPTKTYTYGRTVCRDGWVSPSTGRGTCSWHGGIRR